tara:strand:+ start:1360 stop:2163 length:804 start_codon:yes stop_codon:yes gene_type:complete
MDQGEFDRHVNHILTHGYTVLTDMLSVEECDKTCSALERLAAERARGGFECLFNKDLVFERIYQLPTYLRLIRHFLGADAILSGMHGSRIEPGSGGGGLHADGELTGYLRPRSQATADRGKRITSHVMSLNTIFCLSEFTQSNGATQVVAGSHEVETLDIPETAVERAKIIDAPKGSTIVFNTNLWHGSSKNESAEFRYALLVPWRRCWQRGEYEMARVVKDDVLERAGEQGPAIFGIDALAPYLERWQWDRDRGKPLSEFAHLHRA